jgi:sugar lactone lactonase YvrE
MERELRAVLRGVTFTEGPRWRDGKLWFSDFYTHRVMTVDAAGHAETVVSVPQQPSGLGWRPDGTMLIVSMLDRRLMRLDGGALALVADLSAIAGGPCNDMVVDTRGRAYVGNFGFDRYKGQSERAATLARVDPDGSVHAAAADLLFPNGTVITPDGKGMIIAETMGQRLTWFDIAPDGALSGRRIWADLKGHFPDGICLDAEGAVWVADARGPDLLRVGEGGRILGRIAMQPGRHAFACMLGGVDLWVCSSSGSGPSVAEKRDGGIDVVRVDVRGAGLP